MDNNETTKILESTLDSQTRRRKLERILSLINLLPDTLLDRLEENLREFEKMGGEKFVFPIISSFPPDEEFQTRVKRVQERLDRIRSESGEKKRSNYDQAYLGVIVSDDASSSDSDLVIAITEKIVKE